MSHFSTERLTADRVRAADFEDLFHLSQNPAVMATLSVDGSLLSKAATQQRLRESIEHWERAGYGIWVFRDKQSGRFVGRAGLKNVLVEGREEIELLFALVPEYWGKGLATEMARAILDKAFEQLGIASVVSFTLPTNQASQRVMEKAGFRCEGDFIHAGLPHVIYRVMAPVEQDSAGP